MVNGEWSIVNRQWSKDAKKPRLSVFENHGFQLITYYL